MRMRIVVAGLLTTAAVPVLAASSPVGRWRATEIAGVEAVADVDTRLEIAAGGKVSGVGGCNGFGGKATLGPGMISFGALISTRMACPGPAMDQEPRFERALAQTVSWQIQGEALVLYDAQGVVVARFAPLK